MGEKTIKKKKIPPLPCTPHFDSLSGLQYFGFGTSEDIWACTGMEGGSQLPGNFYGFFRGLSFWALGGWGKKDRIKKDFTASWKKGAGKRRASNYYCSIGEGVRDGERDD